MKRTPLKANISRNITTRISPLPWKTNTPKRQKNASRTPMLPRPRTSRRITIPRRAILPAALPTAPSRILAAAVTEGETAAATGAVIAAGGAVGGAVAGGLAAGGHRGGQGGGNFPPPKNPRPQGAG